MAGHNHLYRDEQLAPSWERFMERLSRDEKRKPLYESVVEWSVMLRSGRVDPAVFRSKLQSLMGESKSVLEHYADEQNEDIFFRLVAGQVPNVNGAAPYVDDPSEQTYGPVPTPVSFIPPFIDDLRDAGLLRDDAEVHDIGCGTGLTTAALALLTETRWKIRGLDWNPAVTAIANRTAESLHLSNVACEGGRAQQADLSRASLFYLHTPFQGELAIRFCRRLFDEAAQRPIAVGTLYDITTPMRLGPFEHVNTKDGYDGIALFRSNAA